MSADQKRARWFGVLYLITFATSIPAALLYRPLLDDPVGYIAGSGHDTRIFLGVLLELLLILPISGRPSWSSRSSGGRTRSLRSAM